MPWRWPAGGAPTRRRRQAAAPAAPVRRHGKQAISAASHTAHTLSLKGLILTGVALPWRGCSGEGRGHAAGGQHRAHQGTAAEGGMPFGSSSSKSGARSRLHYRRQPAAAGGAAAQALGAGRGPAAERLPGLPGCPSPSPSSSSLQHPSTPLRHQRAKHTSRVQGTAAGCRAGSAARGCAAGPSAARRAGPAPFIEQTGGHRCLNQVYAATPTAAVGTTSFITVAKEVTCTGGGGAGASGGGAGGGAACLRGRAWRPLVHDAGAARRACRRA